ncbi:peptide ABC transporter ATP-binding protein [Devosia pacifica]|uniref:Peptide ABC transporter ATP-binding protein n=1 Tax=Devosia pacifica TaxID=1335967 RepID=A0A918VUS1_9HYPH|nr:ABC transporter ATP-binding protein [Devosia pacifica]GHA25115.1 peptide ABC transporter ATP-binding protein [Devosia pacifica]
MIALENAVVGYGPDKAFIAAVDDVTITIGDNEIVGIAGESGCGKSTLLRALYGDFTHGLRQRGGEINARFTDAGTGTTVEKRGANLSELWWDQISYVPQGSMSVLNPLMKVDKQIIDGLPKREKHGSRADLRKRIANFLKGLGLEESVLEAYPHQLSGGMRQRVLVAIAAFVNPRLILADEPTTALDVVVQKRILLMMVEIQRRLKNTLVLVSHDLGVHYQITDRLAIAYAGKIVEIGPTQKIFAAPSHPYTQALIAALPRVGEKGQRSGLEGRPPSLVKPPQGCRFAARCPEAQDICRAQSPELKMRSADRPVACHFR